MSAYDKEFAEITLELQNAINEATHATLHRKAANFVIANPNIKLNDNKLKYFNNNADKHAVQVNKALHIYREKIDTLLDKIPKNSNNIDHIKKMHHNVVSMCLTQRAIEYTFSATEALQTRLLSISSDTQTEQNAPIKLQYLQRRNGKYKIVTEPEAQYIRINVKNKLFCIKISGSSDSLIKQADSTIHAIYGFQNILGDEEAAKTVAAVAEMHIYVRTMANNHQEKHGRKHPNISHQTIADFDYIGLAMQKTHTQWVENGPNAAIAKWNKDKEKLSNFNELETDNNRTWASRRAKELAAPKKTRSPFDGL